MTQRDRRTRSTLRYTNMKLRKSIRDFVAIQDDFLKLHKEVGAMVPSDWMQAYKAMKELMGTAEPNSPDPEVK